MSKDQDNSHLCVNYAAYHKERMQCFQCYRQCKPACLAETRKRLEARRQAEQAEQAQKAAELAEKHRNRQRYEDARKAAQTELMTALDTIGREHFNQPWQGADIKTRTAIMSIWTHSEKSRKKHLDSPPARCYNAFDSQ